MTTYRVFLISLFMYATESSHFPFTHPWYIFKCQLDGQILSTVTPFSPCTLEADPDTPRASASLRQSLLCPIPATCDPTWEPEWRLSPCLPRSCSEENSDCFNKPILEKSHLSALLWPEDSEWLKSKAPAHHAFFFEVSQTSSRIAK